MARLTSRAPDEKTVSILSEEYQPVYNEWVHFLDKLDNVLETAAGQPKEQALERMQAILSEKRMDLTRAMFRRDVTLPVIEPSADTPAPSTFAYSRSLSNIDLDMIPSPAMPRRSFASASTADSESILASGDFTSFRAETLIDALRLSALKLLKSRMGSITETMDPQQVSSSFSSLQLSTASQVVSRDSDVGVDSLKPPLWTTRKHSPREESFLKSFPRHRMLFTYAMKPRSILSRSRSKVTYSTAISPLATRFALCSSAGAWSIYLIENNFNDQPKAILDGTLPTSPTPSGALAHNLMAMNERWLIIATGDKLQVICAQKGKLLYTHHLQFNVQALSISDKGAFIACAIVGLHRETNESQPMLVLFCPVIELDEEDAFEHIDIVTFSSPYRDEIQTLTVSPDEKYLMCTTRAESRFFIISLLDPRQPRVVMRSYRKVVTEGDIEGITSAVFFPESPGIVITSVAPNTPPIVVDTKINSTHGGNSSFAKGIMSRSGSASSSSSFYHNQPSIVLRVDKIGSSIHNAVVSPRENAIAFLDKSGVVYVMHWPEVGGVKKFVVCCEVSNASSFLNAASLRFSPDGTVLFALDRKGNFFISDFGAGLPNSVGMAKLRMLT